MGCRVISIGSSRIERKVDSLKYPQSAVENNFAFHHFSLGLHQTEVFRDIFEISW